MKPSNHITAQYKEAVHLLIFCLIKTTEYLSGRMLCDYTVQYFCCSQNISDCEKFVTFKTWSRHYFWKQYDSEIILLIRNFDIVELQSSKVKTSFYY